MRILGKSSIEAGPFSNLQLQASILGIGPSATLLESSNFKKWDLVPTFSNTQLSRLSGSATSALAYTQLSGKCLFPISVGYKLYDDNRNEVADYTASVAYRDKECKFEHIFSNLDANRDYTVYPKVSLFGHDLLASPSADLEKAKKSIVKITNFKQTDSEYSKNGFSNDGMTYDYKFDVAVTVEIDNLDGVADWGYVYKEPNGNIKRISLMQYGKSCIATQTFYRNEARSTVCLYGYVRYEDDAEYYDAEPCNYNLSHSELMLCPDDNHPHAIDLGLPSGTKWACCNVGASCPEESGGYFAWGETIPSYTHGLNYKWYKYTKEANGTYYITILKYNNNHWLGKCDYKYELELSDDAATVNLGEEWKMPTEYQQSELLSETVHYDYDYNGIRGVIFISQKDASKKIFLPKSGACGIELIGKGQTGVFWSSSLSEEDSCKAHALSFGSVYGPSATGNRDGGYSVRAVCP